MRIEISHLFRHDFRFVYLKPTLIGVQNNFRKSARKSFSVSASFREAFARGYFVDRGVFCSGLIKSFVGGV